MQQIFQYKIEANTVRIEAYTGEAAAVQIPATLEGKPVERLSPYAFRNLRFIESVRLTEHIKEIGSHCFYDCRNLRELTVWDSLCSIEDGALKNCLSFHKLQYFAPQGQMHALKAILTEISGEIRAVIYYGEEKEKVPLIFPRYLHDYEENTMARVINQVTYGCGVHYRECVNEQGIDFDRYDALFPFVEANEKQSVAARIALLRLCYPHKLWADKREVYLSYLSDHFIETGVHLIKKEDMESVQCLLELPIVKKEWLNELLLAAQKLEKIEYCTVIINSKGRRFGREKKTFEF